MDKVTLIRSMHHTMKNHNSAGGALVATRRRPTTSACAIRLHHFAYGSVVDKFAPQDDPPTFASHPHTIADG
jgi:hypothetical protein